MAIQSNSSDVEVAGGGRSLFTGIAPVRVIAVNPTLGDLAEMDIPARAEPQYTVDMGDKDRKLVFWVYNEEKKFSTKLEILTGSKHRKASASGKFQITNKFGQVTWAEKPDTAPDWFKQEGVRRTYPGEEILIDFVKAWANIPNDGECSFDTIDNIFSGKTEELEKLVTSLSDNKLRVLLGVKDGKYQNVYNKCFGRIKPKRDDMFVRKLNDEYSTFNAEYNSDLQLQSYSPSVVTSNEEAPVEAADDPWS